jgi:cathepsin D
MGYVQALQLRELPVG